MNLDVLLIQFFEVTCNVGFKNVKIYLGKQSKKLKLFETCFWGVDAKCLERTNKTMKSSETLPFGKNYCDGLDIELQFCTSTAPNQPWRNAPYDLKSRGINIYFQIDKSLEDCNIIETLKQCNDSVPVNCNDTNRSKFLRSLGKKEENRGRVKIQWSKSISLKHGNNVE